MDPYEAREIDLSTFNPVFASYGPKSIYAPAALVTEDNIGQIALQLERDVLYPFESMPGAGAPFIKFMAKRHIEEPIELTIYPGCWIVLIWNEIHVFKDGLFQKTFEISSTSGEKPQAWPGPEPTQIMPSVGQMVESLSDGTMLPPGKYEKFIEKSSGKQVQFREGVYDQLSEGAQKAFERVDEGLKIYDPVEGILKVRQLLYPISSYDKMIFEPTKEVVYVRKDAYEHFSENAKSMLKSYEERPEIPQGNLDIEHD